MNTNMKTRIAAALLFLASAASSVVLAQEPPRPEGAPSPVQQDDVQIVQRGPVHEAFAEPVGLQPGAGMTAPKAPPPDIEELPPPERPTGRNATWIHGYWAWDEERNDFLWISGVWRIPPQGRTWVDGRWEQVDGTYQRVSGYWLTGDADRVAYLDEPPATLEQGPNSTSPGTDYFWVPGAWQWSNSRYVWQPGYWSRAYPGWVWVPNSYRWTPRGCIYLAGYWDYPLYRRGWLFAPVYFGGNAYRGGFSYRPSFVVDAGLLGLNLFVRPRYNYYYFGDYYGNQFQTAGFYPWYRYSWDSRYYDPFYAYQQWNFGRYDRNWRDKLERRHDELVRNEAARPPRVVTPENMNRAPELARQGREDVRLARRVEDVARRERERPIQSRDALEVVIGRPGGEQQPPDRDARGGRDQRPGGARLERSGGAFREGVGAPPPPSGRGAPREADRGGPPRAPRETASPGPKQGHGEGAGGPRSSSGKESSKGKQKDDGRGRGGPKTG